MNYGNELYFLHPFVNNSTFNRYLPEAKCGRNLVVAYAMGTLLDAMLTCAETVDFIKLRVIGYNFQFTEQQFEQCRKMRNACRRHPLIIELLKTCQGQQEFYVKAVDFFFDGLSFHLNCKVKYDLWSYVLGYGADIKTTAAKTMQEFLSDAIEFDYDRQRAFYMTVKNTSRDLLIGVSKVSPHPIFILPIQAGDAFHTSGMKKLNRLAYEHEKYVRTIA